MKGIKSSRLIVWDSVQNVKLEVGYNKWIKKNLESIDFAMGLDQEGFSFDQVICNRGRILIFRNSKGASR